MTKVKVLIDGNQFGYAEYNCKESVEECRSFMKSPANILMLTDVDTDAIISIPMDKYVVEVWESKE